MDRGFVDRQDERFKRFPWAVATGAVGEQGRLLLGSGVLEPGDKTSCLSPHGIVRLCRVGWACEV